MVATRSRVRFSCRSDPTLTDRRAKQGEQTVGVGPREKEQKGPRRRVAWGRGKRALQQVEGL